MEAAYGLAITVTMLMTTILLFNYLLKHKVSPIIAISMLIFFGICELSFFIANIVKFMHGGYVAVLIALAILSLMYIWIQGHYIKIRLLQYFKLKIIKNN
jgi:KUP system potassium uptake protein